MYCGKIGGIQCTGRWWATRLALSFLVKTQLLIFDTRNSIGIRQIFNLATLPSVKYGVLWLMQAHGNRTMRYSPQNLSPCLVRNNMRGFENPFCKIQCISALNACSQKCTSFQSAMRRERIRVIQAERKKQEAANHNCVQQADTCSCLNQIVLVFLLSLSVVCKYSAIYYNYRRERDAW